MNYKGNKRVAQIYIKYHCEIFLILLFLHLGLYELYYAYYTNFYISADSSGYLMEAMALLRGDGFRYMRMVGSDAWYSYQPVGYPALIAAMAFLSGRNIYLSSKILSVVLVGLSLLVLYLKFKKDSWIYSLVFFNSGFLLIFCYTWSENPFILFLLIYTVALSEIIASPSVKRYWFAVLGLGGVGAFLTRYFGILTVIITMFVAIGYFILYVFKKQYHNRLIWEKIIGLTIVELGMGMIMGSYLLMNKFMAGRMTGVDRSVFTDDYHNLIVNLISALKSEVFNAVRLGVPLTIYNMTTRWNALLIGVLFFMLLCLLIKQLKRRIDYKVVFIVVGIIYYIVFIIVRFHSTMDAFGYRFFVPGSILISIGIIGFIQERLQKSKVKVCGGSTLILLVCCAFLLCSTISYGKTNGAWYQYQKSLTEELSDVPEKSVVLKYGDNRDYYCYRAVRPDLMLEWIDTDDTIDSLFATYRYVDYIYVKVAMIKDMMNNPGNYDQSLRDFFADFLLSDENDDTWVKISVKDQKILSNQV